MRALWEIGRRYSMNLVCCHQKRRSRYEFAGSLKGQLFSLHLIPKRLLAIFTDDQMSAKQQSVKRSRPEWPARRTANANQTLWFGSQFSPPLYHQSGL